ncbi:GNAT family N-acetyltransferase [Tepidibacter aestuarii]|uniref:GNAT family N-acetyltransferase n=1 Tax=Tepidibacter aestuarii TaxID=2925782 RepID=UPI0020BFD653|nr:GNAT family protein [Tepidibacter aestuarii]CAH2213573.1 putative acetyltransferase [Tepidibacter aestuarii]
MALIDCKSHDIELGQLMIECAKIEDAEELISFTKQVDGETDFLNREPGEFNMSIEDEIKFIKNNRTDENSLFLTAKIKNKIVGTIGFSVPSFNRYRHKGQFGIALVKEFWGYGIGSKLLDTLIKWADSKGFVKITLDVDSTNQKAIKLYEKFGFIQEGYLRKDTFIGNGEYRDSIIMGRINDTNL